MSDTIGDCNCINPIDKDKIILTIDNEIERHEEKIIELRTGLLKHAPVMLETKIKFHNSLKEDMIALKKRVENTPECK